MFGIYVYEFAIGMGPKLLSKKGKETEYTFRAIPIGGFCQLAGEEVDEEEMKKILTRMLRSFGMFWMKMKMQFRHLQT